MNDIDLTDAKNFIAGFSTEYLRAWIRIETLEHFINNHRREYEEYLNDLAPKQKIDHDIKGRRER